MNININKSATDILMLIKGISSQHSDKRENETYMTTTTFSPFNNNITKQS